MFIYILKNLCVHIVHSVRSPVVSTARFFGKTKGRRFDPMLGILTFFLVLSLYHFISYIARQTKMQGRFTSTVVPPVPTLSPQMAPLRVTGLKMTPLFKEY